MGPSGEMGLGEEPPFSPTGEPRSASLCPSPLPCLGPLPLSDDVARGCCIDCTKGAVSVTSFFFFFSVVVVVLFLCFVSFEGIFCKMELFSLGLCAGVGAGAQQLLQEVRGGMEDGRSRPPSACRGAEG